MKIGDIVIVNEFKETENLLMVSDMYLHIGKEGVIQTIDESDGSCKVFDWWWTKESVTITTAEQDISTKLKETLSNVLLAYSKQRKEFNIPIKPEAVKVAEILLKQLK